MGKLLPVLCISTILGVVFAAFVSVSCKEEGDGFVLLTHIRGTNINAAAFCCVPWMKDKVHVCVGWSDDPQYSNLELEATVRP